MVCFISTLVFFATEKDVIKSHTEKLETLHLNCFVASYVLVFGQRIIWVILLRLPCTVTGNRGTGTGQRHREAGTGNRAVFTIIIVVHEISPSPCNIDILLISIWLYRKRAYKAILGSQCLQDDYSAPYRRGRYDDKLPSHNGWGDMFKNKENFLNMHICWTTTDFI